MKRTLIVFIMLIFMQIMVLFTETDVVFSDGIITDTLVDDIRGKIVISGNFPVVNISGKDSFSQILNDRFNTIYEDRINEAQKNNSTSIEFEYKYNVDNDIYSILIISKSNSGISRERINTVNFDINISKILLINDILGINGVSIVNKYLDLEIKRYPERFRSNFVGVGEETDFYFKDGKVYLLFNPNNISSRLIDLNDNLYVEVEKVIDVELLSNEYIVEDDFGLRMVPLRRVSEGLGYTVIWDAQTRSVEITKGEFTTNVSVDNNTYARIPTLTRELEASPRLINNVLYVPISFFEIILNDTYTVTDNGKITISTYENI